MYEMRKSMQECKDTDKIDRFLEQAKVGFLGLSHEDSPYVVPLNFVRVHRDVYFHGAAAGRKNDLIKRNSSVCFTVSEEFGTIANPVPANVDTAYFSVIMTGSVEEVQDIDEATTALQHLLNKYVPGYYESALSKKHVDTYRSSLGSRVAVFKMNVQALSAKENPMDEEMKFYEGRTISHDVKGR